MVNEIEIGKSRKEQGVGGGVKNVLSGRIIIFLERVLNFLEYVTFEQMEILPGEESFKQRKQPIDRH